MAGPCISHLLVAILSFSAATCVKIRANTADELTAALVSNKSHAAPEGLRWQCSMPCPGSPAFCAGAGHRIEVCEQVVGVSSVYQRVGMLAGMLVVCIALGVLLLDEILTRYSKCIRNLHNGMNCAGHEAPESREDKTPAAQDAKRPLSQSGGRGQSSSEVTSDMQGPSSWLAGNGPALRDHRGQSLTYAELRCMMQSAAIDKLFWSAGLRSVEQRVAVVMPNGPELAASLLVVMARCTACPLDPEFTETELETCLKSLNVDAVVTTSVLPIVATVANKLGVSIIDASDFKSNVEPSAESRDHALRTVSSDVVLLLFTSGTTGRPKLVPYTWTRLLKGGQIIRESLQLKALDMCLNCMPLFHIGGISSNLLAVLDAGSSVLCTPHARVDTFVSCLATAPQPTWYYASPSIHMAVCQSLESQNAALQAANNTLRLVRSAAGALPPSLAELLAKCLDCKVMPTYGMSECMPIASVPLGWEEHDNPTVGAVIGPELKIDPGDLPDGPPGSGEILLLGPLVMPAYLPAQGATPTGSVQEEDSNKEAFKDGWFRTGDCGCLDETGQLYITGRSKEIINRGGETIPPGIIENAISKLQGVEIAVAFPVKHTVLGETIGVALVTQSKRIDSGEVERVFEFCSAVLSAKYQPDLVVFVLGSQIPRTSTGKIKRNQMAESLELPILENFPAALDVTDQSPRQLDVRSVHSVDSLGISMQVSPQELAKERLFKSMTGLSISCVLLNHMIFHLPGPHAADIESLIGWITGHANMSMLFMLLAYNDSQTGASLNRRDAMLIAAGVLWYCPLPEIMSALVCLATGTPQELAYASMTTVSHTIPMYVTWFVVVAIAMKVMLIVFHCSKCPCSLQVLCCVIVWHHRGFLEPGGDIPQNAFFAFWFYPLYTVVFYYGNGFASWWQPWLRREASTLTLGYLFRGGFWIAFVILVLARHKMAPNVWTNDGTLREIALFNLFAALQFMCLIPALGTGLSALSIMGGFRAFLLFMTHPFVQVVTVNNNIRLFGFPVLPSLSQALHDHALVGVGVRAALMAVYAIGFPLLLVLLLERLIFQQPFNHFKSAKAIAMKLASSAS